MNNLAMENSNTNTGDLLKRVRRRMKTNGGKTKGENVWEERWVNLSASGTTQASNDHRQTPKNRQRKAVSQTASPLTVHALEQLSGCLFRMKGECQTNGKRTKKTKPESQPECQCEERVWTCCVDSSFLAQRSHRCCQHTGPGPEVSAPVWIQHWSGQGSTKMWDNV